jgi:putative radical SAM enzyme (TIGR03279 family)
LLEINNIQPGSTAAGLGLKPGDVLDTINKKEVRDVIDYYFLVADERITIALHTKKGISRTITLDKDPDDTLGLEFLPFPITRCKNRCIFCFVDQMPTGCRKSLYVKEDDFRASFLYGNYITLGALSEADWARIFSQRLTPLYISVHSTDPALRSFMLRNKKAPDIMERLKRLAAGGIRMHSQIVLCPGINDARIAKTVEDLIFTIPGRIFHSVVPVGLTAVRKDCFRSGHSRGVRPRSDRSIMRTGVTVNALERGLCLRLMNFISSGMPCPPVSFYEDLPQVENGVGMFAEFLREVKRTGLPKRWHGVRRPLSPRIIQRNTEGA